MPKLDESFLKYFNKEIVRLEKKYNKEFNDLDICYLFGYLFREKRICEKALKEICYAENKMPSKTKKQAKLMAAAAHNTKFAKKVGIKQSVAKEFNQADKNAGTLKTKKKKK